MEWETILNEQKNKTAMEQQENKTKIIKAFKEMWKTKPTEKQFANYTTGLVLFPECIFIMVK